MMFFFSFYILFGRSLPETSKTVASICFIFLQQIRIDMTKIKWLIFINQHSLNKDSESKVFWELMKKWCKNIFKKNEKVIAMWIIFFCGEKKMLLVEG